MIEFHILGATTLRREDKSFDQSFLKGPKRVALLTYLLVARPRGFHRRDELVALFWPEMGQKSARNALSNMLYHIREALGREAIINRGTEEISIELNPNHWGAVSSLGIVYLQTGRLAQAVQLWKKSLRGNPAGAHIYRFDLALAYRILGLLDRAEQENRASLALAPKFTGAIVNQAHVDLFQGDTAAATKAVELLTRDDETNPYALQSAGWIFILAGETGRAREPLERAYELSPNAVGEGYVRVRLGYTLWQAGERERAVKLFEEFERFAAEQIKKGNEYGMLPYSLAATNAARGKTEQALRWFERAVAEAGWPYELTAIRDPMLASLSGDARFQRLVDKMRKRNEKSRRRLEQFGN